MRPLGPSPCCFAPDAGARDAGKHGRRAIESDYAHAPGPKWAYEPALAAAEVEDRLESFRVQSLSDGHVHVAVRCVPLNSPYSRPESLGVPVVICGKRPGAMLGHRLVVSVSAIIIGRIYYYRLSSQKTCMTRRNRG